MQYFQTLIWTMLFVVFVEMIFPASDLKKYLKLVLSFIVIYMVCSPLVQGVAYLKKDDTTTLGDYISMYQQQMNLGIVDTALIDIKDEKNYEHEVEKQKKGMLEIYEDQISSQVKQMLEREIAIEVEDIEVKASLEENLLAIEALTLEVTYIEKDTVSISIGDKSESIVLNEEVLKKEIKNVLNDFYNWDNTNIYITVQAN